MIGAKGAGPCKYLDVTSYTDAIATLSTHT